MALAGRRLAQAAGSVIGSQAAVFWRQFSNLSREVAPARRLAAEPQHALSGADRRIQWVFLGSPGAGKGTYASRLSKYLNIAHISTGDLVREELKNGSPIAIKVQEVMNRGQLLSDDIIFDLLSKRLEQGVVTGEGGFILDGFPRTAVQAEVLESMTQIDLAVNLTLREEVLVQKMLGRRLCSDCGGNYNIANIDFPAQDGKPAIFMPPLPAPAGCEGKLVQRADDTEETVLARLKVYEELSKPVEDFYHERGRLMEFEITGGIPETWPRLLGFLGVEGQCEALESGSRLAEENLKQLQDSNFPAYLVSLSLELANPEKQTDSRRLAGLILKNSLDAKESVRKTEFIQRWIALDAAIKGQIKAALLATLGSPVQDARHTSAQVVAKIAAIELPRNEWPELVVGLLGNMGSPAQPQPDHLKESTLEALGFVCEEIAGTDSLAQEQVNSVLTAVVQGMNKTEPNNDIRLAATRALSNALEFAQTNFENEVERNYIMTVICEASLCPDMRVRQAAFECLVAISSTYYSKLAPYMNDIFQITAKATREDQEPVALQAVELWSSICDEEIELQEEYTADSEVTNFNFIKQALPALVPMLLETLTKQEEGQDSDETAWNLAMAGGTCLGLVARTVGNDIVPLVMPYVQENISKPEWRNREAATYAFGSILEGPDTEQLVPLVNSALGFMLNAMKDENAHVKDTTAWTLGRIFEIVHGSSPENPIINATNLPAILAVLIESLKDVPNVAEKVCGAIYFLAQGSEGSEGALSMTPYFQPLITALLATADREDASDSRLRSSAYETLNEIVRCSGDDTAATTAQLTPVIMEKLARTMDMQIISTDDREKQSELQALLCGVLQVIIQKLGGNDATKAGVTQYADQMMALFLRVFGCRNATVHEEAMLAIGALAYSTGPDFGKYMPEFYRYLEMGLQNFEEYQVCAVTVGVVGDICRALDEAVLPYCDGIMTQLLKDLSSDQLHRSVKPPIFSCFGDIALAIGEHFAKYLAYAMPMLQSAAELSAQQGMNDVWDEVVEYNNQLRAGIFEAYSGIFQGFKATKPELMAPYAEHILLFIENVYLDKQRDEIVTKAAVGVLGDLADTLGVAAAQLFATHRFHRELGRSIMAGGDPEPEPAAVDAAEEKLRLVVKHGQQTHQLMMSPGCIVKELMETLEGLTNVHSRGQKLIYKGKILTPDMSFEEAKITNNAKIMLMATAGVHQGAGGNHYTLGQSASHRYGRGLQRSVAAPSPVALGQEKARQRMWVQTGIVSLRDSNLQVVPGAVWVAGPALRVLDLGGNSLRIFPPAVTALTNLQRLRLSHNSLTENTIAWEALTRLPNLMALALDHNQIGLIPSIIGQLSSLKRLALSHNALSSLPPEIGQLKNLEWIDAAHNRLGIIPPSMAECTSLAEANFSANFICHVPAALGRLTNLKILLLSNNAIKNFPSEVLTGCTELFTLSLHGNQITIDQLREIEGWEEYDERRRAKYSKRLELQSLASSSGFDEGADAHLWHNW
ncbi:unnamed protein product [Closterium sp. NIES-54]